MLRARAARTREVLVDGMAPYWLSTLDEEHGGFKLADSADGVVDEEPERGIVGQARLAWIAAHVALHFPEVPGAVDAARHGYRYIRERFVDPEHGGVYWEVWREGRVANDRKQMYGQCFAMFALVEVARATGEREPLDLAMAIFRTVDEKAHQAAGGWEEHFEHDWQVATEARPREIDRIGLRSENVLLHLLEPLAELLAETGDPLVRERLAEVVALSKRAFFAGKERRSWWTPGAVPTGELLANHGHSLELAPLLIRAEQVLGVQPSWREMHGLIREAIDLAFDDEHGGFFTAGRSGKNAWRGKKDSWAQSEAVAALTLAYQDRPDLTYARAILRTMTFCDRFFATGRGLVWVESVKADGSPRGRRIANGRTAGYHDVRGLTLLAEAFGAEKR